MNIQPLIPPPVAQWATQQLASPLATITPCTQGRNSRVFRLDTADGQSFALKLYPSPPGDPRDRLSTEWQACHFLRAHALDCIPSPKACNLEQRAALYSFISGETPVRPGPELDAARPMLDFAKQLWRLRTAASDAALPPASEACFSLADLRQSVNARCHKLLSASSQSPSTTSLYAAMHAMVQRTLLPALEQALQRAEAHRKPDAVLLPSLRMPSPSDFGLHNAVRRPTGEVYFLDFEYFGMDDPAKLLSDVYWHPGMDLSRAQRQWFVEQLLHSLRDEQGSDNDLSPRLADTLPLWRFKWVCIVLNPFVASSSQPVELLEQQLAKAKALLEQHEPTFS